MGRKNRRLEYDLTLNPIKDETEWRRPMRCRVFPEKSVFSTGYRAQVAIDEINALADGRKKPSRVYECEEAKGGCGYFHITSLTEYEERP